MSAHKVAQQVPYLILLAERCEAASGDDVLELLNLEVDICGALGINGSSHDAPFTASLDAALTLVPEGWVVRDLSQSMGGWGVSLMRGFAPGPTSADRAHIDLREELVNAIEREFDVNEMIDAAPSVIRRLKAERIARAVLAIPRIAEALALPDVLIDECEHGHKFAKLVDHPKRDGMPRCPHCLAIGLDAMRAEAGSIKVPD